MFNKFYTYSQQSGRFLRDWTKRSFTNSSKPFTNTSTFRSGLLLTTSAVVWSTTLSSPTYCAPSDGDMVLFSANANPELAAEIAALLGTNLGNITVARFADGEVNVQVHDNVRGKDVFIIQPTSPPVNEHLMELLLLVSTMRRASAERITCVIPYYGYARQDRKMTARVPISAADVARLLEAMGVDRVVAVDLHCGQIQGFFGPRVPVDNLDAGSVGVSYFDNQMFGTDIETSTTFNSLCTQFKAFSEQGAESIVQLCEPQLKHSASMGFSSTYTNSLAQIYFCKLRDHADELILKPEGIRIKLTITTYLCLLYERLASVAAIKKALDNQKLPDCCPYNDPEKYAAFKLSIISSNGLLR